MLTVKWFFCPKATKAGASCSRWKFIGRDLLVVPDEEETHLPQGACSWSSLWIAQQAHLEVGAKCQIWHCSQCQDPAIPCNSKHIKEGTNDFTTLVPCDRARSFQFCTASILDSTYAQSSTCIFQESFEANAQRLTPICGSERMQSKSASPLQDLMLLTQLFSWFDSKSVNLMNPSSFHCLNCSLLSL